MALIRDFEIPGTGVVIQDAYHVVTKVGIEKRMADIVPPYDSSREDGLTAGGHTDNSEINWKAGYIGNVAITIWKDANARNSGMKPLGFIGVNPTDNHLNSTGETTDHNIRFFIDTESQDSNLTQAYNFLKTTDYYSGCTEV